MSVDPAARLAADLARLAEEVAREAGRLVVAMRADLGATESKSSAVDVVTAADRASEEFIVERLCAARPDDGIRGEEGTGIEGTSGVIWHIDPIDGTTNYVYDIPGFSVSIAAEVDGVLVAGVVHEPTFDRCFVASLAAGARLDGRVLRIGPPPDLGTALVATGFGYRADRRRHQAGILLDLLPRVRDIRRFGSAALDLCFVAAGQVDAYFERGLNDWDLAAGTVIAREAGARVGDLRGGPPSDTFTLAAHPELFDVLAAILVDLGADGPEPSTG